jgi:hypothetical protein
MAPQTPRPGSAVPPGALPNINASHTCSNSASSRQRARVLWLARGQTVGKSRTLGFTRGGDGPCILARQRAPCP